MSDFYSGEVHQGVSEFFPQKAKTGKRSIKIPAAKMLAAIAGAAVTATLLFSAFVDCFATEILPDSVRLNINVKNLDSQQKVEWQLIPDGEEDSIKQGELESDNVILPLDELEPDTKYKIIFTIPTEDGDEEIGKYEFTTPGEKTPAVSPPPQGGTDNPPGPVVSPPPAVSPSPSPSVAPSPSPSISPSPTVAPSPATTPRPESTPQPTVAPSVTPTPDVEPSPSESPQPTVRPSTSPEVAQPPAPVFDTPYLSGLVQSVDYVPVNALFNFPFELNSNDDYTNETVSLDITYSTEDMGTTVEDNVTVSVTSAPFATDIDVPVNGSATATAVLTYNRTNVATGEVETGLTITSDALTVQALYAGMETEDSSGLEITNLVGDPQTNLLTGTVTVDVGKGRYTAQNSTSELDIYRIWFDIYDAQGNLISTDMLIDYTNLSADNSADSISTNFELNLADLGLVPGQVYDLEVRANAQWLLNSESVANSNAIGMAPFQYGQAPVVVEPTANDGVLSSYTPYDPVVTDPSGNDVVSIDFSVVPNDGTITSVDITESIAYYDGYSGEMMGTTEAKEATYTVADLTADTSGVLHLMHNTTTAEYVAEYDTWYRNEYGRVGIISQATFGYTMPDGSTGSVVSDFTLEPFFYIETGDNVQLTNTFEFGQHTLSADGGTVMLPYTITINDVHRGTGRLELVPGTPADGYMDGSCIYYYTGEGGDVVYVPITSAVIDSSGKTTVSGTLEIPYSAFSDDYLNIQADIVAAWVVPANGTDVAMSQTYAFMSKDLFIGTMYNVVMDTQAAKIESGIDHGLTLRNMYITKDGQQVTQAQFAKGSYVETVMAFTGTATQNVTLLAISDITNIAPEDIQYNYEETARAGTVFTEESPLIVYIDFTMPEADVVVTPAVRITATG